MNFKINEGDLNVKWSQCITGGTDLGNTFIPMTLKNIILKDCCFFKRRNETMGYGKII